MGVNNDLLNGIISGLGNMPKKSEIDTPTNNIDLEATETEAGLMSAADKAKLNKMSEDAGKYELPVATKDTLGGVKTGSDVTDANGLTPVPIIDGIPYYNPGASEVGIPIASGDTLGGVKIGENITVSEDGTISVSDVSADKMTGILPVSKGGTGASDIHKARLNLKTSCFVVAGNITDTDASNDGYYKAFSIPSSANSKYTLKLLISSINALFDDFTVYVALSTGDTTKDAPTGFIYSVKETHEVLNKLLITYDSSITTGEYGFWYKNPSANSAIRITVLQCVYSGDIVNDGYQMISINNAPRTALATITVGIPDVVSFGDILTTKLATQSTPGYMSSEDKSKLDSMTTSVPESLQALRTDVDDAYDTIALLGKLTLNANDKGSDIPYLESKETTSYQFSKPNGDTFTISSDNTIRTYKNASSTNNGLMSSTDYDYLHGLPDTLSNLQETLTNNIGMQLESHISDTSNPHQVTKEQLGLGNVENKTSAVIRSELTKDNVTKGLGYIPVKSVTYNATVSEGVKIGELNVDGTLSSIYVSTDIDTHWTSNLIVGGSKTANTNAAASNGSVFMNLIENNEIRGTHKIVGNTGIRVTSDANGDITITGTTYSSLKNPNSLKLQVNGVEKISYDGSEEKTLDITPALIGASVSDHNHDDAYLKLDGGTLTGPLKILGTAATNPLVVRGISGMNTDGTAGPLYLQYGANSEVVLGNTGKHNISKDGSQYTGNSASATKLASSAGSATQPIYFEDGKPVVTTYTLEKSVPADAKFTDTIYTHPTTSGNKHIPSGGSAGQILGYDSDGTAKWIDYSDHDTTYTAGTGLTLSGTKFNHKNSITAGTVKGDDTKTLAFGDTFTIPTVTYDSEGHITKTGTTTMTLPANPNVDTKVTNTLATTTKAYITGTTSATTNTGTQVFDTGVYLDTTAGRLRANEFSENGKLLVDKYRARLSCTVGQSSPVSDPWFKVGDIVFTNAAYKNYDHMTTFRVFKPYADNGKAVGILTAHIRTTPKGAFSSGELIWEYAGQEMPVDNFKLACQTGSTSFTVELWVKIPYEWQYYHFDYISAGNRTSIFNGVGWNFKSHSGDGVASITEGYKIIDATMLQLRNPIANNMYLPTAGGTMTGDISYKGSKSTFSMIRFLDNTTDAHGNGISIGGGGLTIIGGGESATTMQNTFANADVENMLVCNDWSIDFYTNVNSGASAAKHYWMDGGRIWSERFIAQNDFCINNKVSMQYDSDAECVNFVFS